jgi:hypothetical protein
LLWAGVIFSMSTDTFSSEHTASVIEPILRWLDPSLTPHQFELIRALHGIFCFLPIALSRRARRPERVALDVGHRGIFLRRRIFGSG